jgi:branched-chain amino acid transport system substrate-binding protein
MPINRDLGRVRLLAMLFVAAVAVIGLAVLATSSNSSAGSPTPTAVAAAASKCGLGNGKKATKSPIQLGAIATKLPGTDFTDIPNMTAAYFACVNANGGIKGHPVHLNIETEAINPVQAGAAAKKLIGSEHVLGMVGSSSIIECAVNAPYYQKMHYYEIAAGIASQCYSTPNIASVNMGPRYSSDGAAQYALQQKPNKLVFDQSNVPGTGYNVGGVQLISKAAKVPVTAFTDNVPIQDANSVALRDVQAAGTNGAVVLNFTPPEALKILQAAQQQGLENRVKVWTCSTPCNTDFLATALGKAWNGKFGVNAELNLPSAPGPDEALYRSVLKQYGKSVTGGLGSFSQMGFVQGRIATQALMGIKGAYTVKSVNNAFHNVKNFRTDILCRPWYFQNAPLHIPNNTDRTVVPENGKMVQKQGCFNISPIDPAIAQVRKIEAKNHL